MRVVHVSRYFHPHVGGTENVIAALGRELAACGVESRVLTSARGRDADGPAPQLPVVAVPVAGPARFPVPVGRWADVADELRSADIVHLHDVRFLFELTAAVRRGPVVLSTNGLVFHTTRSAGFKRLVWRSWYGPRLRRLDRVVAISERDAAICAEGGVRRNVVTIPYGVDVDLFTRVPVRQRGEAQELLYFGRVAPEKQIESLAAVLARRPAWRLTVAGAGTRQWCDHLRSVFDGRGVGERVTFTGAVGDEELSVLLEGADCVVLPSPGESFGLTAVEALASGVPVVANDAPAYREVLAGSGAAFVPFVDADAVASAIDATVPVWDPGSARARAREFSWAAAAAAYRKVYDDVLEGRCAG